MIQATPRYFSTNEAIFGTPDLETRIRGGILETIDLAEAIIKGQAPDGGLFMPTHFPSISPSRIRRMGSMEYWQIFSEVMEGFFDGVLSKHILDGIAQDAYAGHDGFDPFIEQISEIDYIGRLDEGPTAAFKDYAAQALFRIIEALMVEQPKTLIDSGRYLGDVDLLTFITATSGDTGGAMGYACHGMDKMWMAILHSADIGEEVSDLQAKQMSRLEDNIHALWIETDFDGCNAIAQRLQSDPDLKYMNPNTANSSNIGRLLPQIAYYFSTYAAVAQEPGEIVYFSVPSGNFGNAVAGLFAIKMGLPIKLIIGVNENDVFERFYNSGIYEPANETKSSLSNSMNINWPSNIRRLFQLFGGQLIEGRDPTTGRKIVDPRSIMPNPYLMKEDIAAAYRISDGTTNELIWDFYREEHIVDGIIHSTLEPHGVVAWGATQRFRQESGYSGKIVSWETAHPGKFPESLQQMGIQPQLPLSLGRLVNLPQGRYYELQNDYNAVKSLIIQLYQQELAK